VVLPIGGTGVQGYGFLHEGSTVVDRLGGLTLFLSNPLMWIIDASLQKICRAQGSVRSQGRILMARLPTSLVLIDVWSWSLHTIEW
jgi:hypothetical protein